MKINLQELNALFQQVHSNPQIMGGMPVFKGTRLSVEHIAKIIQSGQVTKEEIRKDYPCLTDTMYMIAKSINLNSKEEKK